MAEAVRDPAELCQLLQLPARVAARAEQAAENLGLLAPRGFLARIRPGDLDDPLLRQILPQKEELTESAQFSADPLGEAASACGRGLLWKYRGRLLILTTPSCSVHCRFCFRRCFPSTASPDGSPPWEDALRLVAAEPSIEEVILSGGDPLMRADEELAQFAHRLAEIPHVRRLRVHSRMPIIIPQRVTQDLLDWLRGTRLTPIVAVHVNHPAEIDAAVAAALGRLVDAGVPTLAQSVLLRGVNDDVATLAELFGRLVDLRVTPYYLHQLDRVAGAAHFEVAASRGIEFVEELRRRLPHYAIPRYVCEMPGQPSKTVLA
jgi:EF-P beta-lysylation protein EpmB